MFFDKLCLVSNNLERKEKMSGNENKANFHPSSLLYIILIDKITIFYSIIKSLKKEKKSQQSQILKMTSLLDCMYKKSINLQINDSNLGIFKFLCLHTLKF